MALFSPLRLTEPSPADIPELPSTDDRLDRDVARVQLLGELPDGLVRGSR